MKSNGIKVLAMAAVLTLPTQQIASAQSLPNGQDPYQYCRMRAEQVSGYYGPRPDNDRGSVLRGALKGGGSGALGGAIFGKKGKKGKAAKKGAAIGALFGAMAAGAKKSKKRKEEDKRRRSFEFEFSTCMNYYGNQR